MQCSIDHLVITAFKLEDGAALVQQVLGVRLRAGGKHPDMGTHNMLTRLGDSTYLEVISPDPDAPAPTRPRWFELDALHPGSPPALSAWVARASSIQTAVSDSLEPLGAIESMSRGELNWLLTIPSDGQLPLGGAAPALIEWQTDAPPAAKLPDQGLNLAELRIFHPEPARIRRLLTALKFTGPYSVLRCKGNDAPKLEAIIDTPAGRRQLPAETQIRPPTAQIRGKDGDQTLANR